MGKYRTCPICGSNLDHGERCDCQDKTPAPNTAESAGQLATRRACPRNGTHAQRIGARYETCKECGLEWNVSKQLVIPWYGYRCPYCRSKYKRT